MNNSWIEGLTLTDEDKYKYLTPISIETDSEYLVEVKKLFDNIEKDILDFKAPKIYLDVIKNYKMKIIDCITKYYSGDIVDSYDSITSIIEEFKKNGISISTISNSISFNNCDFLIGEEKYHIKDFEFFRARFTEKATDFLPNEMTHIPFNERGKIANQRFSLTGLPCLYLGSTSYCCWEEMKRPSDHNFNVSAIRLKKDFKILNLTINTPILLKYLEFFKISKDSQHKSLLFFKLWIITLVTSFKVKEDNRLFKSEYIIPQIIMLACKKMNIDGVAYLSKQTKNDEFASRIAVNLALLAKYNNEDELSSICNDLQISQSYNYSMYKQLSLPNTYKDYNLHIQTSNTATNIGSYEMQFEYKQTYFYKFDKFLFAHSKLKDINIE
ncbi:MAG: RES domain-containing protein [Bacilli bacterium]